MGTKILENMTYIHMHITEKQKEWIYRNGNASYYIRRLIDKDMENE